MGNIKSVPDCCPASPLRCSNWDGPHTAFDKNCPSRSTPIRDLTSPPPSGDDMDQAEDGDPGHAPPPSPEPLHHPSTRIPPPPLLPLIKHHVTPLPAPPNAPQHA